jgi:TPR repeat protein
LKTAISPLFSPGEAIHARPLRVIAVLFLLLSACQSPAQGPLLSPPPAIEELREAAAKSDLEAERLLGLRLLDSATNAAMTAEGLDWLKKAADRQDPRAEYAMGLVNDDGRIMPRNAQEAFKWYKAAANHRVREAAFNTAVCYAKGDGVAASKELAFEYYGKAAVDGDRNGQLHLGLAFRDGRGVAKDPVQAASWIRRAAENHHPAAEFILGLMLKSGEAGTNAPSEALDWIQRSAEAGYPDAQTALGFAFAQGDVVPMDATNAARWFEKAAAQNQPEAEFAVGKAYLRGLGVPADLQQGLAWLKRAAQAGQPEARRYLEGTEPPAETAPKPAPEPVTTKTWVASAAIEPPAPKPAATGLFPSGQPGIFLMVVAGLLGVAPLMLAGVCLFGLLTFRNRLNSLESQLRGAQNEVSASNQHLGRLLDLIEKRLPPSETQKATLPTTKSFRLLPEYAKAAEWFRSRRKKDQAEPNEPAEKSG